MANSRERARRSAEPGRRHTDKAPALSVDVALFSVRGADLAVLLARRVEPPFAGCWALPGSLVLEAEPLEKAAARVLSDQAGIEGISLEQLGAFGEPSRDPRRHTISVAYFSFVVAEAHPTPFCEGVEVAWVPLREIDALAFDHGLIIGHARARLQERLRDPTRKARFDLVPARFTLTELQHVYEAVLGRALDKRNFRARLLAHELVEPVSAAHRVGRHRPAQLYRWRLMRRGR